MPNYNLANDYFKTLDGLSDENEKLNPEMPRAKWTVRFIDLIHRE